MPTCAKCGAAFKNRAVINGKLKSLCHRKYCLICSPFGQHNTRKLHLPVGRRKCYVNHYKYVKNRRIERKLTLIKLKGGKCCRCGYNRCHKALDFHHVDPSKKSFPLSSDFLTRKPWADVMKEAEKTILVCRNCHAEIEHTLSQDGAIVLADSTLDCQSSSAGSNPAGSAIL